MKDLNDGHVVNIKCYLLLSFDVCRINDNL